jgi:serine/threonine protein kinase
MGLSPLIEASQNFGKYALIEKIGEGHLGPVYRGFDQDLGTPVVVRVLCDGIKWDSILEEIFAQETRSIAALRHTNIASVLDIGSEGLNHYIAMESLGSGTLENLIAQNSALSVETKLSIMIHISEGLSYAHKHGILHRDLVPGKIHLAPNGSAKIRDFAVAHILMKHLPHPVVRWGAPIYLCPEKIQGKECDARSDIFSAGTIFYELLTHVHPFHDRDSNKALDNILADVPIPTFEKFPDAPPGIWPILRNCLAKDPEERYRSADELAEACRELLVSLAEDKQLILSELYASLTPLKKAAAQPDASASTIALLGDIQNLLSGEKEADYLSLDRLMTSLTQEYPAIQAAACAPPELGSVCPQLPPEVQEPQREESGSVSLNRAPEHDVGLMESSNIPAQPPASIEEPLLPPAEPKDYAVMTEMAVTETTVSDADAISAEGVVENLPVAASVEVIPDTPTTVWVPTEYVPLPPSASRYLKPFQPSVRTATVLLIILALMAAEYFVLGAEVAAPIRKSWGIFLSFWDKILH